MDQEILIVSSETDDHALAVMEELRTNAGINAHLLDLSRFPRELRLETELSADGSFSAVFRSPAGEIPLHKCSVGWWRRPQPFGLPSEVNDPVHRRFALSECHEALGGLWLNLPLAWVNHPTRDEEASRKPYQLRIAREVGLTVPRTLITSDPERAAAFVRALAPRATVYKAFAGTEEAWRETRLVRDEELHRLDGLRHAPVIFQEFVPARVDLRITVIGMEVFASAVHSAPSGYSVDYRPDLAAARVERFELPRDVLGGIRRLMDRLELVYGAIDMRLTPDGDFVFLEINPAGQWRFMEVRTGATMTSAFAALLVHLARSGAGSNEVMGRSRRLPLELLCRPTRADDAPALAQ